MDLHFILINTFRIERREDGNVERFDPVVDLCRLKKSETLVYRWRVWR